MRAEGESGGAARRIEAMVLRPETRLYPNYTNHVYELAGEPDEDRFLVYNPSLHYWFATERPGAAMIDCVDGSSLAHIVERLRARFGPVEERDVTSFFENLLAMGFVSLTETPAERSWVPEDHDLDDAYPFEAMFVSLGDACNLDCPYCFNKTRRVERMRTTPKGTINVPAIVEAMQQFKAMGGQAVCFTGGEPTLFKGVLDVCAEAKRIGLTTEMITNGKRLHTLDADTLVRVLDNINVSLDTGDDEVAVQLWGGKQHRIEKEIIEPLVAIAALAESLGTGFRVTIKPIVSAVNLHSLPPLVAELYRLIPGHRLYWDFNQFNPIGNDRIDGQLGITPEQYVETLMECIQAIRPETAGDRHEARRLALERVCKKSPGPRMDIMPCAPSFFIVPTGDVYPCQELEVEEFRLGNIEAETLVEMFAKPAWSELRHRMTVDDLEVCGQCELRYVCAQHCHGESFKSAGETTAFLAPDTSVCRPRVVEQLWLETRQGADGLRH